MDSPPRRNRQALLWVVKIVVSSGLLYLLFSRGNVHLADVWQQMRTASPAWIAASLAIYFVMIVIATWRWRVLLAAQHLVLAFRTLLSSFLVATFFNNFLPSNIGGDVIRIADTSKAAGSKTLAATIVLVDRGIGLLGLGFVAAAGATVAARRSEAIGPLGPGLLWAGLAGAIAVASSVVLMPRGVGFLLRPLHALHQEWFEERIGRLVGALARFRETPRALLACFTGAIAVQTIIVLFYAALARGLGIDVPLRHLAILVPLSFLIQMLPVSVGGLGVRETTFVVYLTQLNVPKESAFALSLVSGFVILLFSTTGAVAYLTRASGSPSRS